MIQALRFSCVGVLMIVLSLLGSLAAQQPEGLSPGLRVRVKVAGLPAAQGRIVSVDTASFGFQRDGGRDTVAVDYARIERLDVSRGLHHRVFHDAAFGGVAGLVIGGIIGAEQHDEVPKFGRRNVGDCSPVDSDCIHDGGNPPPDPTAINARHAARGAALGAVAGFLAGVLVGKVTQSEVWEKIPFSRFYGRITLSPAQPEGMHVSLRFEF